jgi:vacuolar-type H+-ATPase subunit I/STV1
MVNRINIIKSNLKINLSYFIIGFIITLLLLDIFSYLTESNTLNIEEGFDGDGSKDTNSNTSSGQECSQATLSTLVYKNAGAIENLKSSINDIMQNVNKLLLNSDKQSVQIQNITSLQDKYEKIAEEADQIAQANKLRLIQMAKEAQQKVQNIQSQANKLQSP